MVGVLKSNLGLSDILVSSFLPKPFGFEGGAFGINYRGRVCLSSHSL